MKLVPVSEQLPKGRPGHCYDMVPDEELGDEDRPTVYINIKDMVTLTIVAKDDEILVAFFRIDDVPGRGEWRGSAQHKPFTKTTRVKYAEAIL